MRRLFGAIAATAALIVLLVLLAAPERGHVSRASARSGRLAQLVPPTPSRAQLTIMPGARLQTIPRSFLGVSTEYWSLPLFYRENALFERALSLLHVPGDGPLVLRIGGDSADQSFWNPRRWRLPHWAFGLTPTWLRHTSTLVRSLGLRAIFDLNLITDTPGTAARLARAVTEVLPRRSIVGFEIGNEPDIYSRRYWIRHVLFGARRDLPLRLSPIRYAQKFEVFSRAVSRVAPGVPLAGPALANVGYDLRWITQLIAGPHPGLRVVSAHWYPFNACAAPGTPGYPTIGRLLNAGATAAMTRPLSMAVGLAHKAGLQFRLTEFNSVTCGGLRGVSDTFATALWAPDTLFRLVHAGVDGVNVHIRAFPINAPFGLSTQGLLARPYLYGLNLFVRTLGPHAQLVPLRLQTDGARHLEAWGVVVSSRLLHVLLIDEGARPVNVKLKVPAAGPAGVDRLVAPSVRASSGVTLDGQELGADGRWTGAPVREAIAPVNGAYEVNVPGSSAALVSLRLRKGWLRASRSGLRKGAATLGRSGRSLPRKHPRALQAAPQLEPAGTRARARRSRVP